MKVSKKIEWFIVAFTGAVAFVLAFIGFNTYFIANGIERNFVDLIFHSIKIFGMELVDEYVSPLPLTLEIARWLAPGVLLFTAIKGIIYLVQREFKMMRAKSYKNHIVVGGLNEKSIFLINDLLKSNEKVIIVAESYEESYKEIAERNGAILIPGKLSDADVLIQSAAANAKYFVINDMDDEQNISDAIYIHDYLKSAKTKNKPVIYTRVASHMKLNELKEIDFFKNINGGYNSEFHFEIRIFSENEKTARLIMDNYSPDVFRPITRKTDKPLNVAVFGSGELAQSVVASIARLGHFINYKKVKVTLFHEDRKMMENLNHYFPGMNKLIDLKAVYGDLDIFNIEEMIKIDKQFPFDAIYVLSMNESLSLKILNKLCKINFNKAVNVVLALVKPEGVLNKWYKADTIGNMTIYKFDITSETFTKDAILSEKLDELAKIIHNDYFTKMKDAGKLDPAKESHREWEYLSEDFKNQNRMQADHIDIKLRSIGCKAVPMNDPRPEYDITADKKIIEQLAEMEHNRWEAHMVLNGWVYAAKRDDKLKKHPNIIPYNKLTDDIKQYDRNTILNIPMLLAKLNLKIVKAENTGN